MMQFKRGVAGLDDPAHSSHASLTFTAAAFICLSADISIRIPLNVPQSLLQKQIYLLSSGVLSQLGQNPCSSVFIQRTQSTRARFYSVCVAAAELQNKNSGRYQLSERLVPACLLTGHLFVLRPRTPSQNKCMSCVCGLLADEICPLLHFD